MSLKRLKRLQRLVGGELERSKRNVPMLIVQLSPLVRASICWFGRKRIFRAFEPFPGSDQKRTDCDAVRHMALHIQLRKIKLWEQERGARMFMNIPDRWQEKPGPMWRCTNDHTSTSYLKSETKGDLCLACGDNVRMTFPEDDKDGPLVHAAILPVEASS